MNRAIFGMILAAVLVGASIMPPSAESIEASHKSHGDDYGSINQISSVQGGERNEPLEVAEHRVTASEMERLRLTMGVSENRKNYNQMIDSHGTGLRPPTETEWAKFAGTAYRIERISSSYLLQSPSYVDQTTKPWFPPIGNQGSEGSCVAWAVGYYTKTFQEAKEHGWNLTGARWEGGAYGSPTTEYQDRIFSPDFIYHLINYGDDYGSYFDEAINLIAAIGVCTWEKMPYNPSDHTSWPSEEAWREAPLFRSNSTGFEYLELITDDDLESLKLWIASDQLAVVAVDAYKYVWFGDDIWTLDNYVNPSVNHANTIVGYDDTIQYEEEGQIRYGAFKLANSWGAGGWEGNADGCYWVSYEAMKQRICYAMFYRDLIDYKPELVASFRIEHSKRAECRINVSMGDIESPMETKSFDQCIHGGDRPFCLNNILFDITEFKAEVSTIYNQSFHLEVFDGNSPATGTVTRFAVEYAESQDTPVHTVDLGYVYSNVTLFPPRKDWEEARLAYPDNDFVDAKISMATDSMGYLYIAHEDWFAASEHFGISIEKSIDSGKTWATLRDWCWDNHNSHNPSMAIDPYDNRIYVAYERVLPGSKDHDIYCWTYSQETGENHAVVDADIGDDRYASITSEYQYGPLNRQYISYECVNSYDDRDLMLARSFDHGSTWSVKTVHGLGSDYKAYAQASITNTAGYIYIAYKYGTTYDSACDIRVDQSIDLGERWTMFSDVDGLPSGCSSPSIAAMHGTAETVVAFQHAESVGNVDVRYSYTTTNGTDWTRGEPLFVSPLEDEKLPVMVADGSGTTKDEINGYFHAICKTGSYLEYREAYRGNLSNWSSPEFVTDQWTGEGIAIVTQETAGQFYPCAAWSSAQTRDLHFSTQINRWVVDDDGPSEFHVVQEAINAAGPNDLIIVKTGTYYEHIVVNKTVALIGENRDTTIMDGSSTGVVVTITQNGVSVSGFMIRAGQNTHPICNVWLENVSQCSIHGNILTYSFYDIYLNEANGNSVYENFATNGSIGICGFHSDGNAVFRNEFIANSFASMNFHLCSFNNVAENLISSSSMGIRLLDGANNNTIYHNSFVNNSAQIYAQFSYNNTWDDGYPSGGNYWGSYAGADNNDDGIGDTPYIIDAHNRDRYPLMALWGTGTPEAGFVWAPLTPAVNETITFDASSSVPKGGMVITYQWIFGDGNITTTPSPTTDHFYAMNGTYNVTLTVTDSEALLDITWKTVKVFLHDVTVAGIVPSSPWTYLGHDVQVNVTIRNEGDSTENVTVILYYEISTNRTIGVQTTSISPLENQTLTFTWDTTDTEVCHNYALAAVVIVASDNHPADNSLTEGTVSIRILGDITGDGVVDGSDVIMVARAFGSFPEHPEWNPEADVNSDGVVDGSDIVIVTRHYGETHQ